MISITDGIFLEADLFYQGILAQPSQPVYQFRVGGAAQTKAVKSVGGNLKLGLSQFMNWVICSIWLGPDDATKLGSNSTAVSDLH